MYSIFHPLDPEERLPRELLLEGKRHRLMGLRFMELLGFMYLPALILGVVLMASVGLKPMAAFALAGLLFVALFVYVLKGRYR
jgi:hypothetical protein